MTFKEFILKEAGAGRSSSIVRGNQPYAAFQQTPPISAGRSNTQYYQDLEHWKKNIYGHIIHLYEAGTAIEIDGQLCIPHGELVKYHQEALNFLRKEGILGSASNKIDKYAYALNINMINMLLHDINNNGNTSGYSQGVINLLEHFDEMYNQRRLINTSSNHDWGFREKYCILFDVVEEFMKTNGISQNDLAVLKGGQNPIITGELLISFYPIFIDRVYQKLNHEFYKDKALGIAGTAMDAAFGGSMQLDKSVHQQIR